MSAQRKPFLSVAAYLAAEREASYKSEYVLGEVFAMAGGSYDHGAIAANLIASLARLLSGGPCNAVGSDVRIQAGESGAFYYPDFSITCGEPVFRPDGRRDTVTNPIVVIEVLSPSTEASDRGVKFAWYRRIASLQEYILVAQDAPRVEIFRRTDLGWLMADFEGLRAVASLVSIDCAIPLADIYRRVEFPAPPSEVGPVGD
jgi:Uma2 family endonuclease